MWFTIKKVREGNGAARIRLMKYNDSTAYQQGRMAGYRDEDTRSCPYESATLILDWLAGWYDGQEQLVHEDLG
jgi:ribosome modulation factor